MKKINFVKLGILILGSIILLISCSGKNDNNSSQSNSTGEKDIVVATSGAPKPFTYVDENGNLVGYDIDVVKAIFDKIGKYNVSFETTEFTSVLSGLDSGRYNVGANNFAMNDQRKEKYIYTDPIFKNAYSIVVPKDRTDINTFADLAGKTTEVTAGLNYATAIEKYNAANPGKEIKLTYTEADLLNILQNVESKKFDFQLIDRAMGEQFIKEHNLVLKSIPLSEEDIKNIGSPYSYLLVSKTADGEQLAKEINEALKQLINEGKITEISKKYFGQDFAPKE